MGYIGHMRPVSEKKKNSTKNIKILIHVSVHAYLCVCTHIFKYPWEQKKELDPLELDLQVAVSHPKVGAETQTPVYCKSSKCS